MPLRTTLLLLPVLCSLLGAAPAILVNETFEPATNETLTYPPIDAYRDHLGGRMTAWSGTGVVTLTHGKMFGRNGGGGMRLELIQTGTDYALCRYHVPLSHLSVGSITADDLRPLVITFDLLGADTLPAVEFALESTKGSWESRVSLNIEFRRADWTTHRLVLADQSAEALARLAQGMNKGQNAELNVAWYMLELPLWSPGDSFRLDNLKVEIVSP